MPECPSPLIDLTRVRLYRPALIRRAALLLQEPNKEAELRDGSEDFPIRLPSLQSYQGEAVPALVGILPDGTLVAWKAGSFPGVKKIILEDGQFKIGHDYTSDLLSAACEESSCNALDGYLGFKTVTTSCAGEAPTTRFQIVRAPKCCCPTSPEETVETCEEFDNILDEEVT